MVSKMVSGKVSKGVTVTVHSYLVNSNNSQAHLKFCYAKGACEAVGGNILTDAFGIVAMVAMTPLCTIQLLGLSANIKKHMEKRHLAQSQSGDIEDTIVFFD